MVSENDNYLNLPGLSQFFDKLKTFFPTKEDLKNIKGIPGESAGFGTPTATVDANVGTPSVTVTATGNNTEKIFHFEFKNLKGDKGDNATTTTVATTSANGLMGKDMVTRLNLCASELVQSMEPTTQKKGDSWLQEYA